MPQLSENETHVLEALYGWWRHHKQSMVTERDLSRWLAKDGFDPSESVPVDLLVAKGWVIRAMPDVIMLTESGIAEGLRRNL